MKVILNFVLFVYLCIIIHGEVFSQTGKSEFPVLKGPYLGQKAPGKKAEIFAPGIITTGTRSEFAPNFSPDGNEFFITMWEEQDRSDERIWHMENKNGIWTKPEIAPFSYDCFEYRTNYPVGGNKLYFLSKRPLKGTNKILEYANIWYTGKNGNNWSDPEMVEFKGEKVQPRYFTVSGDGTIYFNGNLRRGIYYSELINKNYQQPQPVPDEVQSMPGASHPFIAADKSYIIVDAPVKSEYQGDYDLFISFKKSDGRWTELIHMGKDINSGYFEGCATVSYNGKYIFFSRFTDGQSDIYWCDAKIIEDLRPEK